MILCVIFSPGIGARPNIVTSKLKSASAWVDFENNTWLINTTRTPTEWRDDLKPYMGIGGNLLIIRAQRQWAGLKGDVANWLRDNTEDF